MKRTLGKSYPGARAIEIRQPMSNLRRHLGMGVLQRSAESAGGRRSRRECVMTGLPSCPQAYIPQEQKTLGLGVARIVGDAYCRGLLLRAHSLSIVPRSQVQAHRHLLFVRCLSPGWSADGKQRIAWKHNRDKIGQMVMSGTPR